MSDSQKSRTVGEALGLQPRAQEFLSNPRVPASTRAEFMKLAGQFNTKLFEIPLDSETKALLEKMEGLLKNFLSS